MNVVIYFYSEDEPQKQKIANDTLEQYRGIEIKEKYKLQFYDSMILATALENGCNILFSEDMQHNQVIEDRLTIINPFRV